MDVERTQEPLEEPSAVRLIAERIAREENTLWNIREEDSDALKWNTPSVLRKARARHAFKVAWLEQTATAFEED